MCCEQASEGSNIGYRAVDLSNFQFNEIRAMSMYDI